MSNDQPGSPKLSSQPRTVRTKFHSLNVSIAKQATVYLPVVNNEQNRNGARNPGDGKRGSEEGRNPSNGKHPQSSLQASMPTASPRPDLSYEEKQARRNRTWKPGSFGFDDTSIAGNSQFGREDTFSMMVLTGIAERQGEPQPVMQSEISGAASGAAVVGFGNIAGSILNFASNFLIQRGFGPGPFGIYTLSYSLVSLVASIFTLGMDNAILRYLPIYRSKKQLNSLRGLVIFCTAVAGIAGIIGALVVLFFAPVLAELRHISRESPVLIHTMEIMSLVIPLLCMQVVWYGGLQGFKAFKWRVLSQRIIPSMAMVLLLGIVLIFSRHLNGVVMALVVSNVIATVLSLYYLFRLLSRLTTSHSEQYEVREWLGFATPNFLTVITDTVMQSLGTLLLASFAVSNIALGQYAAAFKFSNFISIPLVSLNTMFAPTISELYSKGEIQKLDVMFAIVTKWTLVLSLPIFGVTTLFSPSLLALSGGGFINAWPLLIAFSLGGIMNAGTGCVGYMLLMTGHQNLSFLNSIAGIVVNVVLGVLLIPRYGAMGAAISTGLAIGVLNLMRLLQVRLLLKIQPYRWDTLKPIIAWVISAIVTGVLIYLLHLLHVNLVLQLLLVPVFMGLYVWLIALFRFSSEDQIVVDKLRKKFLRKKNT